MKNGKKCYCLFAALIGIAVIILIATLHGYGVAEWTVTSWIGGIFIVVAAFTCARCRISEDDDA